MRLTPLAIRRHVAAATAAVPPLLIVIVLTSAAWPVLSSGRLVSANPDYFQYAARHEAVRKSVLEYHTIPLRSPWLGSGYPTIADPEDPTLNPLIVFSLLFGTVLGLKGIEYFALLVAGLGTYGFARVVLRYSRWGALLSGLVYGGSTFIPARVASGNLNEVWAAFLPVCLLLLGLACRGSALALFGLPCLFAAMLSDGKLTALMAMFYMGVLCAVTLAPRAGAWIAFDAGDVSTSRARRRPLKVFLLAIAMTLGIGAVRVLPAVEFIQRLGGFQQAVGAHPKVYLPEQIPSYSADVLWREALGLSGYVGLVSVGAIPIVLGAIAIATSWWWTMPWCASLLLCAWIAMAHHAPVDSLKLLWNLPAFDAIYRPNKYFAFQIVFSIAILAGKGLERVQRSRRWWLQAAVGVPLIALSVAFVYPKSRYFLAKTYSYEQAARDLPKEEGFFQILAPGLPLGRNNVPRAMAFYNLQHNIGTIDWYTGVPVSGRATPKYFVGADNTYVENPSYQGEAFPANRGDGAVVAPPAFAPNRINVAVNMTSPGTLIINQKFGRGWLTNVGTVRNLDGQLAIDLPAGVQTIDLRYRPIAVLAGFVVTVLSLALFAGFCWAYHTGRLHRLAESDHGTLIGRLALACLD